MAMQYFQARPVAAAGGVSGCQAMYQVKEWLKSCGWVVVESGDATTYSAGDIITQAGAGANGLNNTNAWFRIQMPDAFLEFTIQRVVNSTSFRIKLGRAPFNAGAPSATQTPATTVATDEIVALGGGTDAVPTGSSIWAFTLGSAQLKAGIDDAAPYGFWVASLRVDNSFGYTGNNKMILDPLVKTSPGDAFPYLFLCSSGGMYQSVIDTTSSNAWTWIASAAPVATAQERGLTYKISSSQMYPTSGGTSASGSGAKEQRVTLPLVWTLPAGYKGVSTMMMPYGPMLAQWQVVSAGGSRNKIAVSDYLLPWGGDLVDL